MALKETVLQILEAKTKIHARSEEERKRDGRGRPPIDIENTLRETQEKKLKVKEIEDRRNEKKIQKQFIDEALKKKLHQQRNLAAAQESRLKKKEEKEKYIQLLTEIKEFCLGLEENELARLILSRI